MGMKRRASPPSLQNQLFVAIQTKDPERVRDVLAAGADPSGRSEPYWSTPLMIAVGPLSTDSVALSLIEAGANPHEVDEYGFTPLHYAAHLGKVRSCEALLRAGADPNAVSTARSPGFAGMTQGVTALKVASDSDIKRLLTTVTTVSLATGAFAKKLERLRGWFSLAADFEGGEPDIDGMVGFEAEGYFAPVGQSGTGSVFALWSTTKTEEPKDGPVVYFDSEGSLRCAIARSVDEFLSVLPFGTGWLCDVETRGPPSAEEAFARIAAEEEAREDADGKPLLRGKTFSDWWGETFGVMPAEEPEHIVAAAMKAKPTLEAWIHGMEN